MLWLILFLIVLSSLNFFVGLIYKRISLIIASFWWGSLIGSILYENYWRIFLKSFAINLLLWSVWVIAMQVLCISFAISKRKKHPDLERLLKIFLPSNKKYEKYDIDETPLEEKEERLNAVRPKRDK